MTVDLHIAIEPPAAADMGVVAQQLVAYNASHADGATPEYLFIAARDAAGAIQGGLIGATWLGWLAVQALTLDESLRGQGHGSRLLKLAEDEALRRGCSQVFLETLSFQALPFYEKQGYQLFSTLPGFPPGGARHALTKRLG